ncbi:LysR family transcriptional regulator [Aestuariirhabdus sp. Z084]|uniref:LysR family transcriptional regulator n=1 Tax=Aestuariirhabdus haliotis TaxID=2918751 RepID=UPI00201B4000|nr:LysR family transcriptional regulator [Aestuariirhabdus haliotis]MCL6416972.1 LysR family transcriptional regulator [Aestuariirhabdus haliotis]MCL6421021.1 LysR family transcriptional regulator [Aestuariirhabdus haliotis]
MNLYPLLLAIYDCRSISQAAEQLYLTQSAVSHSLKRLRVLFNDPLFERDGRQMRPTPTMVTIYPKVLSAVQSLNALRQQPTEFSLQDHHRHIRLGLRDILEIPLLPRLSAELLTNGSHLTLHTEQYRLDHLEQHFAANEVDILVDAITPTQEKIHCQPLFDEPFVVVVRNAHPYIEQPNLEHYLRYPHLRVSLKKSDLNLVDMALARHQARRKIVVNCEHYIAGIQTVLATDLIMTMPKSFAHDLKEQYPIEVLEAPIELPAIPVCMYWHERSHGDPVFIWFRQLLNDQIIAHFR